MLQRTCVARDPQMARLAGTLAVASYNSTVTSSLYLIKRGNSPNLPVQRSELVWFSCASPSLLDCQGASQAGSSTSLQVCFSRLPQGDLGPSWQAESEADAGMARKQLAP